VFLVPRVSLDPTGRLGCDLACVRCAHNLRGLLPTGACGECGLPVEYSLAGTPLGAADPRWLAQQRWGMATFTLALPWLWLPVAWPVAWVACWYLTAPDPSGRERGEGLIVSARIVLVVLVAVVVMMIIIVIDLPLAGVWMLTLPLAIGIVAVFLAIATLAVRRLALRRTTPRRLSITGLLTLVWVAGTSLLALGTLAELGLPLSAGPAADARVAGLAFLLAIPILLPIATIRLWRELETAEALAADRELLKGWALRAALTPPGARLPPPAVVARPVRA